MLEDGSIHGNSLIGRAATHTLPCYIDNDSEQGTCPCRRPVLTPPPQRTRHPMQLCAHLVYSPTRRGAFRLNAAESVCCESSRAIGRLSFVDRTMVGDPCACNSCCRFQSRRFFYFSGFSAPGWIKYSAAGCIRRSTERVRPRSTTRTAANGSTRALSFPLMDLRGQWWVPPPPRPK